jgi:hypothetical protein
MDTATGGVRRRREDSRRQQRAATDALVGRACGERGDCGRRQRAASAGCERDGERRRQPRAARGGGERTWTAGGNSGRRSVGRGRGERFLLWKLLVATLAGIRCTKVVCSGQIANQIRSLGLMAFTAEIRRMGRSVAFYISGDWACGLWNMSDLTD